MRDRPIAILLRALIVSIAMKVAAHAVVIMVQCLVLCNSSHNILGPRRLVVSCLLIAAVPSVHLAVVDVESEPVGRMQVNVAM